MALIHQPAASILFPSSLKMFCHTDVINVLAVSCSIPSWGNSYHSTTKFGLLLATTLGLHRPSQMYFYSLCAA